MIGIYTQNKNTLNQLISLLHDFDIEVYTPDSSKRYDTLIWLSDKKPPKDIPLLTYDEAFPLTLSKWRLLLQKKQNKPVPYSNKNFSFDPLSRLITNLKNKTSISLTEKENALLSFLAQAPNHQASKETLLQQVWQYNIQTETHTLESHFYALKQKLGTDADNLVRFQNGIFFLV